jgi:hypothetical protein
MMYDGRDFYLPPVDKIIYNCDADSAVKYIKQNAEFFTPIFSMLWPSKKTPTMRIIEKGLRASGLVGTLEKNWKLNGGWESHCDSDQATWQNIIEVVS